MYSFMKSFQIMEIWVGGGGVLIFERIEIFWEERGGEFFFGKVRVELFGRGKDDFFVCIYPYVNPIRSGLFQTANDPGGL